MTKQRHLRHGDHLDDDDLIVVRGGDLDPVALRFDAELSGMKAAGSGATRDPKMVAFAEVIECLSDLFGDEDFTAGQKESFLEALLRTLLDNDTLVTQAAANSTKQFLESPDLNDAVVAAVADNQGSHNKMADYFFTDSPGVPELVASVGTLVHLHAKEEAV